MEMAQIRYALAVADCLNFTRAARDSNVTQPALTKAIRKLEEELGAPLFHREGKRVLVSEFGQSMIPHFRQIIREAEATRELARNFRLLHQTPIRLGVMSTIGHVRLARFLSDFEQNNPGVELSLCEASVTELRRRLQDGEIDLALMNDLGLESAGLHLLPLYSERYVVILPPGHEFRRMNAIGLSDLSGQPYVDRLACEMREMVMQVCEQNRIELYARFRSEREDWVQAMVLAGLGFAFMPEYSVSLPGLVQRPLTAPEVSRNVVLAHMPGRPFSPAVAALVRGARGFAWPG
jgi:DNA-binding transcriptional LysR family regulator